MKDTDSHFWVSDVVKRLPIDLLPKTPSWSALLSAIVQLKTERNNARAEVETLTAAIRNLDLEDGEKCTCPYCKRPFDMGSDNKCLLGDVNK